MAQTTAQNRQSTGASRSATTRKSTGTRSTSARKSTARKPAGRKPAAAPRGSVAAARRQTAATRRSTAAKKASATRARHSTVTPSFPEAQVRQAAQLAERAVLLPVGAALEARDVVVDTATDLVSSYGSRAKVERKIKKFERRGGTARNQLEREVKRTRTRVERELRQRRNRVERTLNRNRTRVEREVTDVRRDADKQGRTVGANVELLTAQLENVVQTGVTAGTKLVSEASERIAAAS